MVVGVCFVLLGVGGLVGCAPESSDDDAGAGAATEEVAEHEAVTLRVAVPAELQGVVGELADAYGVGKDWLTVDVKAFESAKKLNASITPTVEAPMPEGEAAPESDTVSESESSAESAEEIPSYLLPEAEIVFENSASAMDAAEKRGAADPLTRAEMLEDGLVIVASADSSLSSATIANVEAGSYPIAVVTDMSVHAKRQFEVLEAVNAYADGSYAGYYASSKDAVFECEDTAGVFSAVAKSNNMVAIVKTSDVYRYGGVKVVGAVPARMYTAIRYPQALGVNITLLENGQAVDETARDFLAWMTTGEDASRIIEKWGLHFAA